MSNTIKNYQKIDLIAVKSTYVVALLILIGLLVWGVSSAFHFMNYEETNDAQIKEYINPIVSRTGGYIEKIAFEDHQYVQQGDTLVVLETNESEVSLQEAKAALAEAEAQLMVLESNVNTANSNATVNQAQIGAAEAKLWQQQKEYERYKKLHEAEAVTQQQFEDVKTRLGVAKSNLEAVKNTFNTSQNRSNDASTQIAVAKAHIEKQKSVLDRIQLELNYAVILAPSDGYMGEKRLQAGQFVQKGQTLSFIVDQTQGKWVIANFEETQIANLREGQPVNIQVDAFPDEAFEGVIESLSPATGSQFSLMPPDNATGNFVKITQRFPVRIRLKKEQQDLSKLRAGMNVEVAIPKA